MKKYDSVLFDLDGTLTDSGEGIMKSVVYAYGKLHLKAPERNDLPLFIGPPLREIFPRFGVSEQQTDEAIHFFRERYQKVGKYENHPYEGIEDLLAYLKHNGQKLYVATSKPETMAKDILHHFHLDEYFDETAGATENHERETKEAVIAYLQNKVRTGSCVMVGDTAYDVKGAAELHIPCIGVAWGYGSTEEMKQAGAIQIVYTMDELKKALSSE